MILTLGDIADLLGATLEGDPAVEITGVGGIEEAGPGEVTFLANSKYLPAVAHTRASAIIIAPDVPIENRPEIAALRTKDPYLAFTQLLQHFAGRFPHHTGRHASARISPSAIVDPSAAIHAGVVIEDDAVVEAGAGLYSGVGNGEGSRVGEGSLIYPNVVIRPATRVGRRAILHNGVVLGAEAPPPPEAGRLLMRVRPSVVLEDDVEIGSHSTVDAGFEHATTIGAGTKIDNLVHIGAEVRIGAACLIVAQVGISAGAVLGNNVVVAGQTAILPNVRVGAGITIAAQSLVTQDLLEPGMYVGNPAQPRQSYMTMFIARQKLPGVRRTVAELERRVAELEHELGHG